jgi:hypothetical protein
LSADMIARIVERPPTCCGTRWATLGPTRARTCGYPGLARPRLDRQHGALHEAGTGPPGSGAGAVGRPRTQRPLGAASSGRFSPSVLDIRAAGTGGRCISRAALFRSSRARMLRIAYLYSLEAKGGLREIHQGLLDDGGAFTKQNSETPSSTAAGPSATRPGQPTLESLEAQGFLVRRNCSATQGTIPMQGRYFTTSCVGPGA